MKKILLGLVAIGLVGFWSCSNEFELTENWKDIPVVYGLLNQADSAHYIRIEKAFLDESTSALILAQEIDSLYYQDLTVILQETPNGGGSGNTYQLERVNGNLEGYVREEGVFASDPNYLYKFVAPLNENATYRLVINNNENDNTITANTRIAEDFEIYNPLTTSDLRLEPGKQLTLTWEVKPNSKFFDAKLKIRYTEAPANQPTQITRKELDWVIAKQQKPVEGSGIVNIKVETIEFSRFLKNNLEVDNTIVRNIEFIDIIVSSGGEDLLKYIEVGLANTGITGSEVLPTYTNLSEGLGIFSTRYTNTLPDFTISETTKDSLANGYLTKELGFE